MVLRNFIKKFVLVFCVSTLFGTVEHSIVPEIAELYEQIDPAKYSRAQYQEIYEKLSKKEESFRVGTFNILFDLYDDNLPKPYRWPRRKSRVIEMIHHLKPDVLGVQEVVRKQLNDLMKGLSDKYAFFGLSQSHEINGIFYNYKRFTLLDSRYVEPLNLVKLQDRKTGKVFVFCNTHLAFSKIDKREAQAIAIHKIISDILLEESATVPVILTGDMNTFPNVPSIKKLPFLDGNRIEAILKGGLLDDAREVALLGHVGPLSTYTNTVDEIAPFKGNGTPGVFLDHIFVTKDITVLIHAVEPGLVDGLYPSDHLPLIADIVLEGP